MTHSNLALQSIFSNACACLVVSIAHIVLFVLLRISAILVHIVFIVYIDV